MTAVMRPKKSKSISIGKAVSLEELRAPSKPKGRQLSERDLALIDLVNAASLTEVKDMALPWNYQEDGLKPLTARAAGVKAVERAGQEGKVFVSHKDGVLYFSQVPLSKRGRKA